MANTFPSDQAAALLAACHRRCCICHRFCGTKMELDHIIQKADQGGNDIDNAIPVCFDCHAEIHAYNDRHPRGRKFRAEELRAHREQWLTICRNKPSVFDGEAGRGQAGPLEALVDELEFNLVVASRVEPNDLGCLFAETQFKRAIAQGAVTLLAPDVRQALMEAYTLVGRANQLTAASVQFAVGGNASANATNRAQAAVIAAEPALRRAATMLAAIFDISPPQLQATQATASPPRTPPARAIGFEDRARQWANDIRQALRSGGGNTYDVPADKQDFAKWAVDQGILAWDPGGDGVMLPTARWSP